MTLLQVDGLTRRFGALEALADVSVTINEGEIFGLIGPNGSGKTTFFNVITGIYPPSLGRIWLDGQEIGKLPPHMVSRRGMARTFQNLRLVPQMSVFDNIWLAQHQRPGMGLGDVLAIGGSKERGRRQEVEELIAKCGLAGMRYSLASDLPLPDQRRLEIARALARNPRLLLLDEPAGGMTPLETQDMSQMIREVAAPGRTLIVIEHKMDLISGICDRAAVLNFGAKVAEGTPSQVLNDPHVLEIYLGKQADHA